MKSACYHPALLLEVLDRCHGTHCRWTKETMLQLEEAQTKAAEHSGGQLRVHVLKNAGHWLHVDNPHGLMDMMLPSFIDPDS